MFFTSFYYFEIILKNKKHEAMTEAIPKRKSSALEHEKIEEIKNLNFSMLKMKLGDTEEGEGWNNLQCDEAEKEYKLFLQLLYWYPKEKIVPTKNIDTFWHYHILDTRDYIEVTHRIFGEYIHHYPY